MMEVVNFAEYKQRRLYQDKIDTLMNEALMGFRTASRNTDIEGIFIVVKTFDVEGFPTFNYTREGIPLEELEELLKKLAPAAE